MNARLRKRALKTVNALDEPARSYWLAVWRLYDRQAAKTPQNRIDRAPQAIHPAVHA